MMPVTWTLDYEINLKSSKKTDQHAPTMSQNSKKTDQHAPTMYKDSNKTDQHAPTMYNKHPPPMISADREEDEESPPAPPVMLVPLLSWAKLVYLCRAEMKCVLDVYNDVCTVK